MTADASALVLSTMQSFAASDLAFDAARVAAQTGFTVEEVRALLDAHFWNGALVAWSGRRQERTGLPPLFSRHAGDGPGIYTSNPAPDPRPPETMPMDWIVEAPGWLFREGLRIPCDPTTMPDPADTSVDVMWKRSPGDRFNVIDRIERAPRQTRPAAIGLGAIVHVDPGRRGITVRGEMGDVVVPMVRPDRPTLGEIVRVVWERPAFGHAYAPARFERIDARVKDWFLEPWLASLRRVLGVLVSDSEAILMALEEEGESIAPLEFLSWQHTPGTLVTILRAIATIEDDPSTRWVFAFDPDNPPEDAWRERFDLPEDAPLPKPRGDGPDDFASVVSTIAQSRGRPERAFAIEDDGDHHVLVVLTPDQWSALVGNGCLMPANEDADDDAPRPRSLAEARAALAPRWLDDAPFPDIHRLRAFFLAPQSQIVASKYEGIFSLPLPFGEDIYLRWGTTLRLGTWVHLSITAPLPLEDAWTRERLLAIEETLLSPIHVRVEESALDLALDLPFAGLGPCGLLAALRELADAWNDVKEALASSDDAG